MPDRWFFYHLVIIALLMGAMVGGTLGQAKITYAVNASRTIPTDLLERNKAIMEKYKEIAAQRLVKFPTIHTPSPSPTEITPTTDITRVPTAYPTLAPKDTQIPATSNATTPPSEDIRGNLVKSVFFAILLAIALIGGCVLLHLALLLKDLPGPVEASPWWYPVRWVFVGAHALMAALFFLQAMAFIESLLLWNVVSGHGIAWIILGGFLLVYGAVSSVGIAYSSSLGRVLKRAFLGHILLFACGVLVCLALVLIPILPFSTIIPAFSFLCGLCIAIIQVWKPHTPSPEPAVTYTDTMLFEDAPPSFTPPFPPELEQRYTGARFLHQGGIARVFSARRRDDGIAVAVKVPIKTDEQTGRSLLREMGVWRTLTHPGIVQVNATNILPVPYVEMEYLPGSLLEVPLPMEPCDAAMVIRKVAQALAFAHDRGVIHRDLKPGNILLAPDGEPKIGDWGLSRNDTVPAETTLHGFSLSYAAPEQLDPGRFGRPTRKTDIYQLGIIFYQLVTGVLPFPGESIAEITRERLEGRIRAPSSLAPPAGIFDAIIRKCLEIDPADRYQTLQDFLSDLEACMEKVCGPLKKPPEPGEGSMDDTPHD